MPTKVTSIRLDADILDKATAFGLNISRLCDLALRRELNKLALNVGIVPEGTAGISQDSRVIVAGQEFKAITKIRVGDRILSLNRLTNRVEEANVIDVGPLTQHSAFSASMTIENSGGTRIQVLPETEIFCRKGSLSDDGWFPAKDIQRTFLAPTISHKSQFLGSTSIEKTGKQITEDVFFRLEVYPNNSFFANSNPRRRTHYIEDYAASVWAFLIKGHPGQISSLLEQRNMSQ